MTRSCLESFLIAATLCATGALAASAQTTRIDLSKSGNDVQVTMSDTSGPWRVVRSTSPQFNYQAVLLATAASSSPVTDANAVLAPALYFYDASDEGAGEVPADQGQPTQENLYLTSLSPTSGWEGQSITINGGGFSSEPTEDQVFFGPIQAVVTGATSAALTVTVPAGVTTGPVLVQVSALTSNPLTFTAAMESSYSGSAFQNISSIVFNDRTTDATSSDHLFFSDMGSGGTADYFYEVMDDYSLTQRAFWNEIKGLAMDPSGNLYYANTTLAANTGLIKKYDTATHAVTTYTNAKLYGEANSVSIVGLAYRPDGVVFAANRYDNTIRTRLPANPGAAIFVTGYPLDLYMGMAMDSAQNLYFTSGGTLYMTPTSGSASVSTVATGFTNASGIAIDESTGNTLILIADRGAGSVYLLNAQTGLKDLVTSGLTSPRAVAFGKDKVTGELYYYVAEATRVLRLPDPRIKLDNRIGAANIKVLISKRTPTGTTDAYPCSLQHADAQIVVPFDVEGEITNQTIVYAKLYDPPDPSAYVAGAGNDNHDPTKNGATNASFQACLSGTSFTVDATHRHFEVTLTTTNQYAGDNYQVGFSFDPAFLTSSAIQPSARTGRITAWKRVYLETKKMYKQGGCLKISAPSTPPNTLILWNDSLGLQPNLPSCANDGNPCFQIELFDGQHRSGSAGAQTAWVTNVAPDPANTQTILTLDRNITVPPGPPVYDAGGLVQNFSSGQAAGIGVVGSDFWGPNLSNLSQPYNEAFVEYVFLNGSGDGLPFVSRNHLLYAQGQAGIRTSFHLIWSRFGAQDASNVVDVLGTAGALYLGEVLLGDTDNSNNWSYIFRETIEDGPWPAANSVPAVTDHELAHQFHTNRCVPVSNHDTRDAWCAATSCSGEPCLNRAGEASNLNDSTNKMCVEDLVLGDPTCTPQSSAMGSVRGNRDPE